MSPEKESPVEVMNRFMWVDQSTIRIINREGVEKLLDLKDNFREIEYNVIPLFNNGEVQYP